MPGRQIPTAFLDAIASLEPGLVTHSLHSDTNQWFFNPVDDKRQVTRVLLILALVISRTVNLEGTGCVLDGWTRWLLSVLRGGSNIKVGLTIT